MNNGPKLRKVKSNDRPQLYEIAKKYLVPIYGDQSKALNEWLTGKGYKTVFVLEITNRIGGLLSLKRNPNKDYIKISTFLIIDEFKNNKFGSILLTKSIEFAQERGEKRLIVTVSEAVPESVIFFLKNGFNIINYEMGKYKEGVVEFIMERRL